MTDGTSAPKTDNLMLEAALAYLRRGISVVPLHSAPRGRCTCGKHVWPEDNSAGKHTRILWDQYQKRLPKTEEVEGWWRRWPDANIGQIMGRISKVLCVECDSDEKVAWVREVCGGEPRTETHHTHRGPHYIFLYPDSEAVPSRMVGPHGVEVKGDGTLIVAPPSVHPSGKAYTANGLPPAPLPEALLAEIRKARSGEQSDRMTREELRVSYSSVPRGEQHNALTSLIGHYIGKGYDRDDIEEMALMVGRQYDPPADPEHVLKIVESLYETDKRNHPPGQRTQTETELVVVPFSDIEPAAPDWLWKPYLLRGQLNMLAGPPGAGKTTLALDIAARITTGWNLFGLGDQEWRGLPGRVVFMSVEDEEAYLRFQFDKLGGDADRIVAVSTKSYRTGREGEFLLSLQKDLPLIERLIREPPETTILIVDNLSDFLGEGVDTRRANEVAPILSPLVTVAGEARTCVLLVAQFNKGPRDHALEKIADSAQFGYKPRSILFVGEDPEDKDRRVMTHVKANRARRGETLGFVIDEDGLRWAGVSTVTTEDLLMPERERTTRSKLEEAMDFLRQQLAGGPRPGEEVGLAAFKAQIKDRTLEKARAKLHIRSYAHPRPGPGSQWLWELPEETKPPEKEL